MKIDTINKVIYIANPKTGSTSLRDMMHTYRDKELHKKLLKNGDYHPHHNFKKWKKILLKYNINIDEYFVFTTIRNPFKRIYSWYNYCKFDKVGMPWWVFDKYKGYSNEYTWETFIETYPENNTGWPWCLHKFIDFKNDNYNMIIKIEDIDINKLNNQIYKHCGVSKYFDEILKTNCSGKKINKIYYHNQLIINKNNLFKDDFSYGKYKLINVNDF